MNNLDRLQISGRVFSLAAILGLSLVSLDAAAVQATFVLGGIAAAAAAASLARPTDVFWIVGLEAVLVGLVIGVAHPQGLLLLPYLAVTALIGGATRGAGAVALVVSAQLTSLVTSFVGLQGVQAREALIEAVAPWLVTSLGLGLLGVWFRQARTAPTTTPDPSYVSAHRLLSQLRTVARRLSSGLDTASMAAQMLTQVEASLASSRSAAFVRSEGGVLAPIGYLDQGDREGLHPDDDLVDRCWTEMEPVVGLSMASESRRQHRVCLPMRVGSRMIGIVIADCPEGPDGAVLRRVMRSLDDLSLRLDTALTFDEVRSIATSEERHRLAREIHDGIAQEIASLGYAVDELAATASTSGEREQLVKLRKELSRIVSELRLSIFDLRSDINPTAGLGSALSDYVREVGTRSGLTVHLTLDEGPTRLRREVEAELLRIAQEAITNARKHAGAENLWVDCRIRPPFARIEVRDDGSGGVQPKPSSYGLRIMRERAARIDGVLEIGDDTDSSHRPGARVVITVGSDSGRAPDEDRKVDHGELLVGRSGNRTHASDGAPRR